MYAYAPDNLIELDVECNRSQSECIKFELMIITVSDVQIVLGFVMGSLALLVASRTSEDAGYEIE